MWEQIKKSLKTRPRLGSGSSTLSDETVPALSSGGLGSSSIPTGSALSKGCKLTEFESNMPSEFGCPISHYWCIERTGNSFGKTQGAVERSKKRPHWEEKTSLQKRHRESTKKETCNVHSTIASEAKRSLIWKKQWPACWIPCKIFLLKWRMGQMPPWERVTASGQCELSQTIGDRDPVSWSPGIRTGWDFLRYTNVMQERQNQKSSDQ